MAKYKITKGQNLYDVAMHIYGSIEGITDLLICNPNLSMASTLKDGDELTYTDDLVIHADIVAYFRTNSIVPANGGHHVYYKVPQGVRVMEVRSPAGLNSVGFAASGSGTMEVDWGDNSPLETITLGDSLKTYHHSFDNTISEQRKIRFYGDFRIRRIDLTALRPASVLILRPVHIEDFIQRSCDAPLVFVPLLDGVYRMDLSGMKIRNLKHLIECRDLMTLNLSGVNMQRETLDDFLIALVREHNGRRNCEITLTQQPSGEYKEPVRDENLNYIVNTGMEAVWLLVNEPAWNEGGHWKFNINDNTYTNE